MAQIMVRVEAHRTYTVDDALGVVDDVMDWANEELPNTWHIDVAYETGIN